MPVDDARLRIPIIYVSELKKIDNFELFLKINNDFVMLKKKIANV
jgi:hypothetical protein